MSSRGLARHGKKRDANEKVIVDTWEAMGAFVESISGKGSPDTLVHYKGQIYRCEVKGAKRGLTKAQVESFAQALRAKVPTYVVRSPIEARLVLYGTMSPWREEDGALAGASRKERPFRPGTDRARSLGEMCKATFCVLSALPGTNPPRCAAHAAEETFAPGPVPPCDHCGEEYRAKCFDPKAPPGSVSCRKDVHCYRYDGHDGDCRVHSPRVCTT